MRSLTGLARLLALIPVLLSVQASATIGFLDDFRFSGDLDGDGQDELVLLFWDHRGDSGTLVYMNLVAAGVDGEPESLVQLVGDSVQVLDARIQEEEVQLEVIRPGEEGAACCGSRKMVLRWKLEEGKLVELPPEEREKVTVEDLEGRAWRLQTLGDRELAGMPEITLEFAEGKIGGSSGCNRYFAAVTDDGEQGGGISIGPVGSTRKACPPAVMKLEQQYLEALRQVTRFSFEGSELLLSWGEDGEAGVLRFVEVSPEEQAAGR